MKRAGLRQSMADLESCLRAAGLWTDGPPAPERLDSDAPFAHDSLEFHEWLQWVLIPRTHALLDAHSVPPFESQIAAMGEWYAGQQDADLSNLVELLERIDHQFGSQDDGSE